VGVYVFADVGVLVWRHPGKPGGAVRKGEREEKREEVFGEDAAGYLIIPDE